MRIHRRRWSDSDRYFGPFTYARDDGGYKSLAIVLKSGDDEYPESAQLRFSGFGHTLIMALPGWLIRPYREKIFPQSWNAETIERLGRDWYMHIDSRKFGVSYHDGFVQVFYGRSTHDSSTDRTWCKHLPWMQWRHIRHSFYGLDGEHVVTIPESMRWGQRDVIEAEVPAVTFKFGDFDGEQLKATTRIEEREWLLGTGWFKWLSVFAKPKIRRSLDIQFSGEVGRRKGSWKGGTIGTGFTMLPDELHEEAFRRYCADQNLVYLVRLIEQEN